MLNLSPQDICGTNISQLRGRTDKPHICKNSCGEWTVNSVDIIHLIGYDLRQRQPLPALKWQAANAYCNRRNKERIRSAQVYVDFLGICGYSFNGLI